MKLRLTVCAIAAGAALFAGENDVTSAQTYAVMNVTNAYTDTVIAVPWVGLEGGAITISNLVNTTTLSEGDRLYFHAGNDTWYMYEKDADGNWGVGAGTYSTLTGANKADGLTVPRGTGLILQRTVSGAGGTVLLCGRVDSNNPSDKSVPGNSSALIANPKTELVNITVGNVGDQISVPGNGGTMKTYEKKSDGWYETVTDDSFGFPVTRLQKIATGVPLDVGKGAFYKNNSSSAVKIQW